ncbi:hypothetical protein [Streptomyces sp. NBC_01443]|uniref:hypothetical protein n=1 Tax=Streptomyces sp. NBC_01443 TaxID=2903868 RepID=UPI0022555AEB|nr:hypothetical protein [Streptomyces sp. NBC_01443]MCX4625248.1 hypothetical protein [Streptomyces sp. NBC_01443]
MQDLVVAVQATGAHSFLPVPGIADNDPSQWLTHSPTLASVADRVPRSRARSASPPADTRSPTAPRPGSDDRTTPHDGTLHAFGTGLRHRMRTLN